ncbi:pyridoxamine 5'-phosphate oxidase family protein [Paracoccus alkanivorans]|uniref:Pyridoxamine 5'-phosphate oxidase family protein n=1 Tax=Paracoccus alkanivorans TaxID=2116655 RepID=A0A3M0M2W3_9RHOB|nr:pyridoxamine 5'-phosphate oxidase family protein [Paracoccus alkanivorans]RMC32112.1 pyridoxamine 5'-phosphate oxidase family protein [Paracoccus alkanivorans]
MITSSAHRMIEDWRLGFVATADAYGAPNLSPKGTFVVHDSKTIGFAEIRSPDTLKNIALCPQVEISFVDILTRRAVLIGGTARSVARDSDEFARLFPTYEELWPDLASSFGSIVLVDVTACRPTCSPAYDNGATASDLRRNWMQRVQDINSRHEQSEVTPC